MMESGRQAFDPLLLQRAAKIRLLVLDVDGVLTDGKLYFDQAGNEMKAFSTRDGFGIKALQRFGIPVAIITGRSSSIVQRRAEELGISLVYQGCMNKLDAFNETLKTTGLDEVQACYAGDDWIDLPVLDRAGLAVTVADADPLVKSRVHWVTENPGGRNAVREICHLILVACGLDEVMLQDYLHP
jgi:3-deoxy-D-manno-octulosonate 8-phosphate phosphatase (KDO 8-P phosphatase)